MLSALNLQEIIINLLVSNWKLVSLIVLIFVTKSIITSPAFKGWWGEQQVIRFGLKKLDPTRYTVFNDLYLPRPDDKGTTQIDHLIISPYGIFVIETKNYRGWIFGSEKQHQWTQQIYKNKRKFQNPIHQNQLHINALSQFLEIEKSLCHSIIMFIGDCTFKTELPSFVITRGLLSYIRKFNTKILTTDQIQHTSKTLNEHLASQDKKAIAKTHLQQRTASLNTGVDNF